MTVVTEKKSKAKCQIHFSANQSTKKFLQSIAKEQRITMSNVIRNAIVQTYGMWTEERPEAFRCYRKRKSI